MARFNTALTSASITGTATIGSPNAGSFTNLTGTAPYTVTVPNPQLHPGVNQVFYNATSGVVTLTTPSGNFNGTGGNGTASISVFAGNVVSITSDGTHYVVISEDGSALTATTGSFSGNVTMNGSGATVSITPSTLTVAPTGASTIDAVAIGSTTRAAGAFTSLAANAAVTLTANTASSSTGTGTLVVTGGIGASGQVTASAVSATNLTGTIQTASQPNITSVGTLSSLTVSGNILAQQAASASAGSIQVTSTDPTLRLKWTATPVADKNTWEIRSIGNGTTPYLQFRTINDANTVFTDRVAFTNDGNVGIGTANPSWPLTVKSGSSGTVATFLYDGAFAGTSEANIGLRWYNGGNASDIPQVKLKGYGTSNYTGNFGIDVLVGGTYPNGFAERFTIQGTTGNVGIGETNPNAKLHVKGTAGNAIPFINFEAVSPNTTFNWVSQAMASNLAGGNNLAHFIGKAASVNNSAYFAYKHSSDGSTNNILTLGLYGVDNVLNINGLGYVGIGTQAPVTRLHVAGAGNVVGGNIHLGDNTDTTAKWTYLTGAHYNGASYPTGISLIGSYSSATANAVVIGGSIYEAHPATEIQFWTHTATTHTTGGSQRLLINSGGDIVFGGGQAGVNRNFYFDGALNKASRIIFREAGVERWLIGHGAASENANFEIYSANGNNFVFTRAGNFTIPGTVTATSLVETSSIALKENVEPITGALDLVNKLMGKIYDRRDTGTKQESGLIAEEVFVTAPNLVALDEDGKPVGVKYTKIIAYLIESIKELSEEITKLKGK